MKPALLALAFVSVLAGYQSLSRHVPVPVPVPESPTMQAPTPTGAPDVAKTPLPFARHDDLAPAPNGSLVVLDKLDAKAIAIVDAQGNPRGRLALEGPGLDDPRDVSRVITFRGDVFVERNGGGPLLRIGSLDGTPAKIRDTIPGIPTADGFVTAGVTDEDTGRAWVSTMDREGAHRWTRELRVPGEVSAVGFVDSAADAVWVVLFAGSTRADYIDHAVCLDRATGAIKKTVDLAVSPPSDDATHEFSVAEDGSLVAKGAPYPCR